MIWAEMKQPSTFGSPSQYDLPASPGSHRATTDRTLAVATDQIIAESIAARVDASLSGQILVMPAVAVNVQRTPHGLRRHAHTSRHETFYARHLRNRGVGPLAMDSGDSSCSMPMAGIRAVGSLVRRARPAIRMPQIRGSFFSTWFQKRVGANCARLSRAITRPSGHALRV